MEKENEEKGKNKILKMTHGNKITKKDSQKGRKEQREREGERERERERECFTSNLNALILKMQ